MNEEVTIDGTTYELMPKNRLEMLVEHLGGLIEWEEGTENWHIFLRDGKWETTTSSYCYEPEKVYMTKEVAEEVCKILNSGRYSLEGEYMSWRYGIVHKKLDSGEDWYYVAEIYNNECHSDYDYLKGLGGESVEEVMETVNRIADDILKLKPVVMEDLGSD